MGNLPSKIQSLRDRIQESEAVTDEDRDLLISFSDELEFRRYSENRHIKLLQHCAMMAGSSQKYDPGDLPDTPLSAAIGDDDDAIEAAKDVVRWIHRNYDNEDSNRDFRIALRMLGGHVTPGDPDEKPASVEQINAGWSKNYDPSPDPTKMYWWEDHMLPIIDNAKHNREAALLAVAWDAGPRSGELRDLRIGDIADHKYGLQISVEGKVGRHSVVLITSVPYLNRWLSDHPDGDNPEAPVWSDLDSGRDVSYKMKLKMLRKPVQTALDNGDVRIPSKMDFTRMRKSSASYLASQNVSQVHLENHHGWERGSKEAARYIAVFGTHTEREIARAHGVDVTADEPDPIAPATCVRCQRETPREKPACVWCGQVLSQEGAEAADQLEAALADEMAEAETAEERGVARGIYESVRTDPEFRAEVLERFGPSHDSSPSSASVSS